MFLHVKRFHMVGIGGSGMSGLAQILHGLGFTVTGSDEKDGDAVRLLQSLGVRVHKGHESANLGQTDVLVRSSAVTDDNPEIIEARRTGVPVVSRGELLAEITRMGETVAVAGTHGKTSTTSIISCVTTSAGLDPTVIIGGRVKNLDQSAGARLSGARHERSLYVVESDESDGSFLKLHPALAVVTNIDTDHLDHYGSMENLVDAFREFLNRVPFYGVGIICADDERLRSIRSGLRRKTITYGFSADADWRAENVQLSGGGSRFTVRYRGELTGEFALAIPGRVYVLNALASIAAARELEIPLESIRESLMQFRGVGRRFESRGEFGGIHLFDDYGHHPTEILATLETARLAARGGRIFALFQPHRYTRTRRIAHEFGHAFDSADFVFVTDIYAASEKPLDGISGQTIVDHIRRAGHASVTYTPKWPAAIDHIVGDARAGDIILTLGAGDIDQAPATIEEALKKKYG